MDLLGHLRYYELDAVGVGFEPTVPFPRRQFSRLLPSATRAPHRLFAGSTSLSGKAGAVKNEECEKQDMLL